VLASHRASWAWKSVRLRKAGAGRSRVLFRDTPPSEEPHRWSRTREIRRAKAKRYVEACNRAVHDAPWTTGRTNTIDRGGIYRALELAEQAYEAHELSYEGALSKMSKFPPGRFRWVYDDAGSADECVKVLDTRTSRLVIWPYF